MHLTLSNVDHLQDVLKLFLGNTLHKDERVWMLVAKKKVLENLEDGDGEDDDGDEEYSGDDGLHLESSMKKGEPGWQH